MGKTSGLDREAAAVDGNRSGTNSGTFVIQIVHADDREAAVAGKSQIMVWGVDTIAIAGNCVGANKLYIYSVGIIFLVNAAAKVVGFYAAFIPVYDIRIPQRQRFAVPFYVISVLVPADRDIAARVSRGVGGAFFAAAERLAADDYLPLAGRRQRAAGQRRREQEHARERCEKPLHHFSSSSVSRFFSLFRYFMHSAVITTAAVKDATPTST